jgi:hypothetical protein
LNTGGRYNPSADTWAATGTTNAPDGRYVHTAVWTGSEMIIWGGGTVNDPQFFLNTGGRYNPSTDSWIATSTANAPFGRYLHTAVWTGSEMIIWVGDAPITNTGGRYCAQPSAPLVQSAVSRKTHGQTPFDIALPFRGKPGIECRSAGTNNSYQLVLTFLNTVTFTEASVTSGSGAVSGTSGSGTTVATINLAGVTNAQTIYVTLFSVTDGNTTSDVVVPMSILVGDTTGNGVVNSSDVSQTKAQSGHAITTSNFREDVSANGAINSSDVSFVKSKKGTGLP